MNKSMNNIMNTLNNDINIAIDINELSKQLNHNNLENNIINNTHFTSIEELSKHKIYKNKYQKNDLYWGIGIENESYLQFDKLKKVNKEFMLKNGKRERYCIDYYKTYKSGFLIDTLNRIYTNNTIIELPIMMNAHSFQKTDMNNEPMTLYTKMNPPNPKFTGKTLIEHLQTFDSYFKDNYEKSFIFDGDTIEFVTQNFYKTTVEDCIEELIEIKKEFITHLQSAFQINNIFKDYGTIHIARINHPFAIFLTNDKHYTIFNNMTYHFNFTIPSKLNENAEIEDKDLFLKQHQNAVRILQWITPLFLPKFGSKDFLSCDSQTHVSKASQRCAISRYIGIGTYDTKTMKSGKLLQVDINELSNNENPDWWFKRFHQNSDYVLDAKNDIPKTGFDFNFYKHKNHGIEFRIFDYFDESQLTELLHFIVYLLDFSLSKQFDIASENKLWNDFVLLVIQNGKDTILTPEIIQLYESIFEIKLPINDPISMYYYIYHHLKDKYKDVGYCSTRMIRNNIIIKKELSFYQKFIQKIKCFQKK